jgi:hypothetical protein
MNREVEKSQEVTTSLAHGLIRFLAPDDWDATSDTPAPIAAIALEPLDGQPFRASMVLTIDELPDGLDLNRWQKGAEIMRAQRSDDWLLIDLERLAVAGRPGARRLGTFAAPGGLSVTIEQWMTVIEGHGVTLTTTSATLAYHLYAPILQAYARSLTYAERNR